MSDHTRRCLYQLTLRHITTVYHMAFLSVTHIIVLSFVSYTLHYAITLSVSDAYCTRAKLMNGHILMGAPLTVYVKEA